MQEVNLKDNFLFLQLLSVYFLHRCRQYTDLIKTAWWNEMWLFLPRPGCCRAAGWEPAGSVPTWRRPPWRWTDTDPAQRKEEVIVFSPHCWSLKLPWQWSWWPSDYKELQEAMFVLSVTSRFKGTVHQNYHHTAGLLRSQPDLRPDLTFCVKLSFKWSDDVTGLNPRSSILLFFNYHHHFSLQIN